MRVTTAEFIRNYGQLADVALSEPVTITKNGHDRLVVIAAGEYQRLKRRDRAVIPAAALSEADAKPVPDEAASIEEIRKASTVSSPPPMTGEERGRRFMEWAQSHADDDAPLLSDEAVSRASFYSDRW